jgi:hypothetical protein
MEDLPTMEEAFDKFAIFLIFMYHISCWILYEAPLWAQFLAGTVGALLLPRRFTTHPAVRVIAWFYALFASTYLWWYEVAGRPEGMKGIMTDLRRACFFVSLPISGLAGHDVVATVGPVLRFIMLWILYAYCRARFWVKRAYWAMHWLYSLVVMILVITPCLIVVRLACRSNELMWKIARVFGTGISTLARLPAVVGLGLLRAFGAVISAAARFFGAVASGAKQGYEAFIDLETSLRGYCLGRAASPRDLLLGPGAKPRTHLGLGTGSLGRFPKGRLPTLLYRTRA